MTFYIRFHMAKFVRSSGGQSDDIWLVQFAIICVPIITEVMMGNVAKFLANLAQVFLILTLVQNSHSQRWTVEQINDTKTLRSADYNYTIKNLDVAWNISFSAQIEITEFDIDTQAGEFVVICEYPLPDEARFGDGAAAEDVVPELPLENSLLVTDNVLRDDSASNSKKLTVKISNENGGFVYFHALQAENDSSVGANGFIMSITYYDPDPPEMTTTTQEPPPENEYIMRYLIGLKPSQVSDLIPELKAKIADMANDYCNNNTDIILPRPVESGPGTNDDVRLDNQTIYFCDATIPDYENCVQIKLAIFIRDENGSYVFTNTRLTEMWDDYSEKYLNELKLRNYIEPEKKSMDTTTWIAALLGVVLAVGALLTLIITSNSERGPRNRSGSKISLSSGDASNTGSGGSGPDRKHPVVNFIAEKSRQREQDQRDYFNIVGRDVSSHGSASSRTNPLLLGPSAFENEGFVVDDEPSASRRGSANRRNSPSNTRAQMHPQPIQFRDSDSEEEDFSRGKREINTGLEFDD